MTEPALADAGPRTPEVDPWRALDRGEIPRCADEHARAQLGSYATGDPRRVAGLVAWLVRRAGLDGATALPVDVLAAALRSYGVDDPAAGAELALAQGRVAAFPEDRVVGVVGAAAAEERIADALVELVANGSLAKGSGLAAADLVDRAVGHPLTVASVPRGDSRRGLVRALAAAASEQGARTVIVDAGPNGSAGSLTDAEVVLVDGAERLALTDAAGLLERLAHGGLARLVLLGDEQELDGPTPGRCFGDVVDSGVVPVCRLADVRPTAPLSRLGASVRQGELPMLDPADRAVVVTPATDPAQALARAGQLVATSVPRVFDVPPDATRVATLRTRGSCGVTALNEAVRAAGSDVTVARLDEATRGTCEALVLVLPAESAGSLSRAALLSAAACATRHLSIVHQAGPALAHAVAHVPRPRRRTRLAGLLRDTLA